MTEKVTPAVGQEWQDWDIRMRTSPYQRVYRIDRIEDGYAHMTLVRGGYKHLKPRQRTRVKVSRLRPNSTGYKLVKDAA